jgi:hypothetical protein
VYLAKESEMIEKAVPWLSALAPVAPDRDLSPASSGAQLTRATRVVGPDAVRWAVEVGQDVAVRVSAEIPGHVGDGGLDVLRMGTESTILELLMILAGEDSGAIATTESLAGIPDFVRRKVSLEELLRGIGLGHAVIAAAFLTECGRLGEAERRHEQMRALSQRMFGYFDAFSTLMAAGYREEQERWEQSETASRFALVEELLQGREQPREPASRRLRYDLARTHVALIVWTTARTLDADEQALLDAARTLIREAGCDQKLVLSAHPGVVWAWVSPSGPSEAFGARVSRLTRPPQTHAAVGSAGVGLVGFRTSHEDASAVFAVRTVKVAPVQTTVYSDVDLLSLLLVDRKRALRFARTELGALAAVEPAVEELRRTLAAYLDEGGSPIAASLRLQVSRNTVTYRIRRAEEMLGRSVVQRRQQLRAALLILQECTR